VGVVNKTFEIRVRNVGALAGAVGDLGDAVESVDAVVRARGVGEVGTAGARLRAGVAHIPGFGQVA
jgi:hypothetical protein